MKTVVLIFFTLQYSLAYAQEIQREIDTQVWKPFTVAIMNQDVSAFVKVHSKDLIRAERTRNKIMDLGAYQKNMEANWPAWKETNLKNQSKYTFELRFTERLSNGDLAYEVGYFKNETTSPSGEKRIGYGKFQVALRKENGIWKILVDSDSNEGGTITEKDFQAGTPLSK